MGAELFDGWTSFEKAGDIAALSNLQEGDVLFIDEIIAAAGAGGETLPGNGRLSTDLLIGRGAAAVNKLSCQSLPIGATTGRLAHRPTRPLGIVFHLDFTP
jgi:Holliday junction resolvasome RuvABC ATP-dependent DNA helicase subunit